MWDVSGHDLQMSEGDWGLTLPITISGATMSASDAVKIVIKKDVNGDAVVEKTFTNIEQNTVDFVLTQAESALLTPGTYVYSLDWYQDGAFSCNIIPAATFKVGDKA